MKEKIRADIALVQQGLVKSREAAQAHIMAGVVYDKEEKIIKPSQLIPLNAPLTVRKPLHPYVSRGGLKLEKGLKAFSYDPQNVIAMDIGAATGGFTDVLLQNGAQHVYAIDVGYGQLDWTIRNHPQVTVMERTNARYLTKDHFPLLPVLAVMDVSFISIELIIPPVCELMGEEGTFITLIKPQFEAGKDLVEKKGVVKNPDTHRAVIHKVVTFVTAMGWQVPQITFSPIKGPEGNIEFLAKIQKNGLSVTQEEINQTVAHAHEQLK